MVIIHHHLKSIVKDVMIILILDDLDLNDVKNGKYGG